MMKPDFCGRRTPWAGELSKMGNQYMGLLENEKSFGRAVRQ